MAEIDEFPNIPKELQKIIDQQGENLCSDMDEKDKSDIYGRVSDGYECDLKTMSDYLQKYEDVLDLAGMKGDKQDKTFPFVGASQVKMPYLAQAAIDFNSRTTPEVVNKRSIAKVNIWGKADWEETQRAERVASAINWQLKRGIRGWGKSHDWALLYLPVIGQYFTKKWWEDGEIKEQMITSDKMVYNHDAECFEEAEWKSHKVTISYNDYRSGVVAGRYERIEELEKKISEHKAQVDEDIELIETHGTLDLDEDGYSEPYIITWSEDYQQVVRVEARYQEIDIATIDGEVYKIEGEDFFTQTGFIPNLEKPAVYDGYGTLFYDYLESMNTQQRQFNDAGTLANIAGSSGFINTNIKMGGRAKKGKVEMIMGQFTPIDVGSGQNLNQSIYTLPFQGPNAGAYKLYEDMREEFRIFTTAAQSVDANPGEAAALYLARLQQALKVPTAIMSRVYAGLSGEFNRIYYLMGRYMPNEQYLSIIDWEPDIPEEAEMAFAQATEMAAQAGLPPPPPPEILATEGVSVETDFNADPDIIPTADPTMGNEFERMARAEAVRSASAEKPQLYNQYEVEKNYLEVMGEPRVDLMLPQPSGEPDPMQVMQQQYMQTDIQSMQSEAENRRMRTALDRVETMIKLMKAEPEIDKLESETGKNWAEVDANERRDLLALMREEVSRIHEEMTAGEDLSGKSDQELWQIARGESQ